MSNILRSLNMNNNLTLYNRNNQNSIYYTYISALTANRFANNA